MRNGGFLIVVSVILIIYALVNYYLYVRGIQAFALSGASKRWFAFVVFLVSSSFVFGIFLERGASSAFSEWIFRIGTFWLAFLLYFILAVLLIDMVRILNSFLHFLPAFSERSKLILGLTVVSVVSLIVVAGHINALWINVRNIPLTIEKTISGNKSVRILMASDLHLGALIGERRERKLLEIINHQKPDLVLFCGDLVDSEIAPVVRKNLGVHLQEIKTPLGVYAILGNHEYIGGINKTLPYLESINIKVLKDEVVTLKNGIQLVGRNDRSASGFKANGQKPLAELIDGLDLKNPIVVMNHQPYNLSEASDLSVDLHLSGHTHHGQLWPFNYITKAIFELSWGYLKKSNTHFYVSSGFGTWGPSVRTGNRPEVVVFDVSFVGKK